MKKILAAIFIFSVTGLFAQTSMMWQQTYGAAGSEYAYRVRSCLDQGYIVAGSTASNGPTDGYLVRTDSLGLIMWSKYFVGNNIDVLRSIRQLPDSGYIIAGYSNSAGNGGYDGWVLRTDKNGDTLWTKYIGTSDWDFFYDVAPTWDGGFVLTGGTYGLGNGDEDMYFVKIDSAGNVLWTKTYGGIKTDEASAVIQTGDSLLMAIGYSCSLGDSLGDSWLLRMNQVGDTIWTRTLGQETSEDRGYGLTDLAMFGRVYVVGESSFTGDMDAFLGAYSYSGSQIFMGYFGIPGPDNFKGVVLTPSLNVAAIGTTENIGGGNGDMYLFHDRGIWGTTSFGTFDVDGGESIDLAHDNGYIACGYTQGFNSILPNMYLVKIDTVGNSTSVVGIQERPIPNSSGSMLIFPNPSQTQATFSFNSTEVIEGELTTELFDISGRKIMSVPFSQWQINSSRSASCTIQTSQLNNGIYQLVISNAQGGKTSGKLIVAH